MSVAAILVIVAVALGVVDIIDRRGRSYVGWAVVCIGAAYFIG